MNMFKDISFVQFGAIIILLLTVVVASSWPSIKNCIIRSDLRDYSRAVR